MHEAAALAGSTVEVLHVVGGGSQNTLLCKRTAHAVGDRTEIVCDGGPVGQRQRQGGHRRRYGGDERTAYRHALGAAGERGVDRVLEWFGADVVRTMSQLSAATVSDLTRVLIDLSPRTGDCS